MSSTTYVSMSRLGGKEVKEAGGLAEHRVSSCSSPSILPTQRNGPLMPMLLANMDAYNDAAKKVAKWLRKGGPVDALGPVPTPDGKPATAGLLPAAASNDHLEMVKKSWLS